MDRHLTPEDRKRLIRLYEDRLAQFGAAVQTLGWGSKADQWLRFSILSRGLSFDNKRVLDVGCGFGEFIEFLHESGSRDFEYVGVDIAPGLVKEARRRYNGNNIEFIAADIMEECDLGNFDIVVSSGAMSFRVADNISVAKSMIAKMFGMAKDAVAANFLSSYVDYQLPKNFHYQPESMFAFARTLTRWVRLYHDYPLYEFTLQLLRNQTSAEMQQRR